MTNFNYKKFITENKLTQTTKLRSGILAEGQFSWMTQDTNQQIGSQDENKIPVYMFDDKGKYYYENDYDGYGVFGGVDYYELLDKMNGGEGDRSRGIDLSFGKIKTTSPVLYPALITKPREFDYKTHDFTQEAPNDPNQSWYMEPEEEDYNGEDYGDYNDDESNGDGYIDDTDSEYDTGVDESKKEYYKDAEADDAEHIKALEKDMKDDKKSSKMKMSELKAKIKEMALSEMNLDINDETPESEEDFLAEVDRILAEADEEVAVDDTEVAVGDEENIDVDTTVEVDPNVKAVQDSLTQAQAAAQKLGDPKLTDQIGNTITFFTRAHVVEKGAVAEVEEMEEVKTEDLNESMFPMLKRILK